MSETDTTVTGQGYGTLDSPRTVGFVSLNDIFKESLRRIQSDFVGLKAIVRCESLPLVPGNREDLSFLFQAMLQVIFSNSGSCKRLFLHVNCSHEADRGIFPDIEFKKYQIRFHTNIATRNDWHQEHQSVLDRCHKILLQYQGDLRVNNICGAGCVFSVSVPGKLQ